MSPGGGAGGAEARRDAPGLLPVHGETVLCQHIPTPVAVLLMNMHCAEHEIQLNPLGTFSFLTVPKSPSSAFELVIRHLLAFRSYPYSLRGKLPGVTFASSSLNTQQYAGSRGECTEPFCLSEKF